MEKTKTPESKNPNKDPKKKSEAASHISNEEYLPISNISKIMKSVLDPKLKISKEAKALVEECVTEFICFITSEASEKCKREKRKTVNSEDLLTVMNHLGFDNYVVILNVYMHKYKKANDNLKNEVDRNIKKLGN